MSDSVQARSQEEICDKALKERWRQSCGSVSGMKTTMSKGPGWGHGWGIGGSGARELEGGRGGKEVRDVRRVQKCGPCESCAGVDV